MDEQSVVNAILRLEDKKYPYYDVIGIEIVNINKEFISYRVEICSRNSSYWRKVEPIREINISKLIEDERNERIKIILE